jgi:hypothetical protein
MSTVTHSKIDFVDVLILYWDIILL